MAYDYDKAFALTDDPFKPKAPLEGLKNPPAQDSLETKPLLINREPALKDLYSPEAGRFRHYLETFQDFARSEGYRDDTDPPRAGPNSFLFSIYGYEGTGKTTLAQVMIRWVQKCKPKTEFGEWYVHDDWSLKKKFDSAEDQIKGLNDLQAQIVKEQRTYNCIVVDNLLYGARNRAFDMFDELSGERIVLAFFLTNDNQLFKEVDGTGIRPITSFFMIPLTANGAVAFIRDRIQRFRAPNSAHIPWLAQHTLFPFDEADIRSAFNTGAVLEKGAGYVSLRQFNRMVARMLKTRMQAIDNKFDIAQEPEANVENHIIRLMKEYEELIKVA